MIWVIAWREFRAMFLAPLAWVILAVIQVILGFMFLANLDNFLLLQPQLQQLISAELGHLPKTSGGASPQLGEKLRKVC